MNQAICVFASSSQAVENVYFLDAEKMGQRIGQSHFDLIFGAGKTGLMCAVAKGVRAEGGRIIGVVPEALNIKGVVHESCDELIVTNGMRERKRIMDERSTGFIALPGGYGTLEEILEIITLKQLRYHNRPIILLNTNGYYSGLLTQFEASIEQYFAKAQCRDLYYVADTPEEAMQYFLSYEPLIFEHRWMTDVGEEVEF